MEGLISIVIPVYKVEKYLNRCLQSVVNQTYKNIEILLIDDGSPDNCPIICENWKKKDNRIKVIHKKNEGLGKARNTGINHAIGEYICFFDSDDYIRLDTIEKCYKLAKGENSDVVIFGFKQIKKDGKVRLEKIPNVDRILYKDSEIEDYVLPNLISRDLDTGKETNLWMSAWAEMYSMKLIKKINWKFESERAIISEDIYSLLVLYKNVNKVSILNESLYFYCENEESLTHKYMKDRYAKIRYFYRQCKQKCNELNYNKKITTSIIYPYFANTIMALKIIVKSDLEKNKKKEEFNKIANDKELIEALQNIVHKKISFNWKVLCYSIIKKMNWLTYILIKIKS